MIEWTVRLWAERERERERERENVKEGDNGCEWQLWSMRGCVCVCVCGCVCLCINAYFLINSSLYCDNFPVYCLF